MRPAANSAAGSYRCPGDRALAFSDGVVSAGPDRPDLRFAGAFAERRPDRNRPERRHAAERNGGRCGGTGRHRSDQSQHLLYRLARGRRLEDHERRRHLDAAHRQAGLAVDREPGARSDRSDQHDTDRRDRPDIERKRVFGRCRVPVLGLGRIARWVIVFEGRRRDLDAARRDGTGQSKRGRRGRSRQRYPGGHVRDVRIGRQHAPRRALSQHGRRRHLRPGYGGGRKRPAERSGQFAGRRPDQFQQALRGGHQPEHRGQCVDRGLCQQRHRCDVDANIQRGQQQRNDPGHIANRCEGGDRSGRLGRGRRGRSRDQYRDRSFLVRKFRRELDHAAGSQPSTASIRPP